MLLGFTASKGTMYYILFILVVSRCLCGNDGLESGFKIFRSERDVFTNLKCTDDSQQCTAEQCKNYNAECTEQTCEFCRCKSGTRNTFMRKPGGIEGLCMSDDEIEPKSVPTEKFLLRNNEDRDKCLKVERGSNYIIADKCSTNSLDMHWVWTKDKQLMNVKTLKCMKEPQSEGKKVTMMLCADKSRKMFCKRKSDTEMEIGWQGEPKRQYLHLSNGNATYATSYANKNGRLLWRSNKTHCKTRTNYLGCYRFTDDSFMAYLNFSKNVISIAAPIFIKNSQCQIEEKFESSRDGQKWNNHDNRLFSKDKTTKSTNTIGIKIRSTEELKVWNGSLLKLSVVCREGKRNKPQERHCVLLKLKSLPTYKEAINREKSESSGTNSVTIAVTVTLLFVALALILGFLVYNRRRRRLQRPANNHEANGAVTNSKGMYEDPDQLYEALKEEGHKAEDQQRGETSDSYSYPDTNFIANPNPTSSQLEYTYARDTDIPRINKDNTNATREALTSTPVYHTLDKEAAPSSDFYTYPEPSNIFPQAPTELEYTYAKDTEIPTIAKQNEPLRGSNPTPSTNDAMYHILEQEKPALTELEYSYAKNTDVPWIPTSTGQTKPGNSSSATNNGLYHTLEEPSPPKAPVYSTLEEPKDIENQLATDEMPNSSDPMYIDVIEDPITDS